MKTEVVTQNGRSAAAVFSDTVLISDGGSALDLMMTVRYETGCDSMIINKEAFCEAFFVLSSGIAGEVLQKFINYHVKLAIVGDFTGYTSKPLRDFIYESNCGETILFLPTKAQAAERLLGGESTLS